MTQNKCGGLKKNTMSLKLMRSWTKIAAKVLKTVSSFRCPSMHLSTAAAILMSQHLGHSFQTCCQWRGWGNGGWGGWGWGALLLWVHKGKGKSPFHTSNMIHKRHERSHSVRLIPSRAKASFKLRKPLKSISCSKYFILNTRWLYSAFQTVSED